MFPTIFSLELTINGQIIREYSSSMLENIKYMKMFLLLRTFINLIVDEK